MQIKRGGGRGFTLAELLIVMAIIVVLAAVAIPTFSRQLETSRETGDMELVRSAYTEALAYAIQDASDGQFDGAVGGTTLPSTLGIVYTAGTNKQDCTYTVEISKMAKGAEFAQNGTVAVTSTTHADGMNEWSYISNKLYDETVPPMNKAVKKLTFKFAFDAGEVVLKPSADTDGFFCTTAGA